MNNLWDLAYKDYQNGMKYREIAEKHKVSLNTVKSWKTRKWNGESACSNDKNRGAPKGNKNPEKYVFFSKCLHEDISDIIKDIENKSLTDILWENIQIQYAAIIRAQNIMHVKDKDEMIKVLTRESNGDTSSTEEWEFQFAWDRQATFLQAQSRAMKTLEGMIKSYDDLLHKNWDLATEEQKARIAVLKSKINNDNNSKEDKIDKYFEALEGAFKDGFQ